MKNMVENNPRISVIIPVYNAEPYINRCIDSVLAQGFTDFEVLIIDDGSTDRSGEICDEYAVRDARIRVFHKENGGVSAARNVGLDNARGEWIAFVDADDHVGQHYLSVMVDWVSDSSEFVMQNIHTPRFGSIPYPNKVFKNDEIGGLLLSQVSPLSFSGPVCKLYSSEIIKNKTIRFPLGIHNGEDGIFLTKYLVHVSSIAMIEADEYYYNRMEGGLSSRYRSFDEEWQTYSEWRKVMIELFERFPNAIPNPIASIWKNRIGQHFVRCLQCGSRMRPVPSFAEQVILLKRIPRKDVEEYKEYFCPNRLRRKFIKYIFCRRMYRLFVLLSNVEQEMQRK